MPSICLLMGSFSPPIGVTTKHFFFFAHAITLYLVYGKCCCYFGVITTRLYTISLPQRYFDRVSIRAVRYFAVAEHMGIAIDSSAGPCLNGFRCVSADGGMPV